MLAYLFLLICVFDMYSIFYPNQTEMILSIAKTKIINLSYYFIYFFSCGQILFLNLQEMSEPILKLVGGSINKLLTDNHIIHNNSLKNPASLIIEFYLNGKKTREIELLYTYNNIVFSNLEVSWLEDTKRGTMFDFIIASYKECGQKCTNKLHYNLFPTKFYYSKSYIRFLSMELTYKNVVYPIKLETDYYNHYYVGNVIDILFFKYYLKNVLQIEISSEQFDYSVVFIDQNVNIVNLYPSHSLTIREKDYEITLNIDDNADTDNELKDYVTLDN
jgi:hypothetical protein